MTDEYGCYVISCKDCETPILTPEGSPPVGWKARWVAGRRGRSTVSPFQYYGQSGHSAHSRMKEHGGVEREGRYEAEIVSTHRHNLGRLVKEGSIILEATNFLGQDRVLNSRAEWGRGKMVRLQIRTDSY